MTGPNVETPLVFNALYQWLHTADPDIITIGGSATPALSVNELINLSTDPETTLAALNFRDVKFNLGSDQGDHKLRANINALYDTKLSALNTGDIIVTNGTTGANHIVHQSLLSRGDHVICQYPIYGPCIEEPKHIGCDISFLQLDAQSNWAVNLQTLESLFRPGKTKLLMLNNPVNPTGTHFNTDVQREIIKLCKKYNVILHCDEIFRPFFHTDDTPTSFIEHVDQDYDNVVVTSSLSKAYGGSGVRVGWIASRSTKLQATFKMYRRISCMSISTFDEVAAAEILSPRCRPAILSKHLGMARTNIDAIEKFVTQHAQYCDWVHPTAGSVGFVRFKDPETGQAVDDIEFCKKLVDKKKVLLAPATMCFEFDPARDAFKGRVRIHFTCPPQTLQKGLELLGEFLAAEGTT